MTHTQQAKISKNDIRFLTEIKKICLELNDKRNDYMELTKYYKHFQPEQFEDITDMLIDLYNEYRGMEREKTIIELKRTIYHITMLMYELQNTFSSKCLVMLQIFRVIRQSLVDLLVSVFIW